jgi:hypothetical protein
MFVADRDDIKNGRLTFEGETPQAIRQYVLRQLPHFGFQP